MKLTRTQILVCVIAAAAVFGLMIRNEIQPSPPVPAHTVVGRQGVARFVVVSADIANHDATLWEIAEHPRRDAPGQTIQAMFWTDRRAAPTRFPLDDAAMANQIAQININPNTGLRELKRQR